LELMDKKQQMQQKKQRQQPSKVSAQEGKRVNRAVNFDPPAIYQSVKAREGMYCIDDDSYRRKKRHKKQGRISLYWMCAWIPDPMANFVCQNVLGMVSKRH
jgi:hypothetical protein